MINFKNFNHSLRMIFGTIGSVIIFNSCNIAFDTSFQDRGPAQVFLNRTLSFLSEFTGFGGVAYDMKVYGKYAFVAKGLRGVEVYDISDITNEILINTYPTSKALSITLSSDGSKLFLADDKDGLKILDISNPLDIFQISEYKVGSIVLHSTTLSADESKVFLAYGVNGVHILDLSDINTPTFIGSYSTSMQAYRVALHPSFSQYVLVANGSSGLTVLDITDLNSIVVANEYGLTGTAKHVEISSDGTYAYVAKMMDNFEILNVSDPVNIGNVNNLAVSGSAIHKMVLSSDNNYLFVACGARGLRSFDVSNPFLASQIDMFNTDGDTYSVSLSSDELYAYVADNFKGVFTIDVSTPSSMVFQSIHKSVTNISKMIISSDESKAWVLDSKLGVVLVDMADETKPKVVSEYKVTASTREFTLSPDEQRVYYTDLSNYFMVVDYSNPQSPNTMATMSAGVAINDMKVSKNPDYLLLATGTGFKVYNVSDSSSPVLGPSLLTVENSFAMETSSDGNFAFISNSNSEMKILSIENSINGFNATPIVIGTASTSGIGIDLKLTRDNNFLFVADNNVGMSVIDVSDTSNPVKIFDASSIGGGSNISLSLDEKYAYVSASNGLAVFDVTNRSSPSLLRIVSTKGVPGELVISSDGNQGLLAEGENGITSFDLTDPSNPVIKN